MLLSPVGPLPYAAFVPLFYSTPRGMVLTSWIPLESSGDGLTARWVPPHLHGSVEADTMTYFTKWKDFHKLSKNYTNFLQMRGVGIHDKTYNTFHKVAHIMLGCLSISGDGLTRTILLLNTRLVAMEVTSWKGRG